MQSNNQKQVVAAIIKKNNRYLIAQRNKNKHLALKWEFPGGKVNFGETFKEALIREKKEELNIIIKVEKKIADEYYKDNIINVRLHYFLCSPLEGIIELNEHENIAWVQKKDFINYEFAEGDGKILSLL